MESVGFHADAPGQISHAHLTLHEADAHLGNFGGGRFAPPCSRLFVTCCHCAGVGAQKKDGHAPGADAGGISPGIGSCFFVTARCVAVILACIVIHMYVYCKEKLHNTEPLGQNGACA